MDKNANDAKDYCMSIKQNETQKLEKNDMRKFNREMKSDNNIL